MLNFAFFLLLLSRAGISLALGLLIFRDQNDMGNRDWPRFSVGLNSTLCVCVCRYPIFDAKSSAYEPNSPYIYIISECMNYLIAIGDEAIGTKQQRQSTGHNCRESVCARVGN